MQFGSNRKRKSTPVMFGTGFVTSEKSWYSKSVGIIELSVKLQKLWVRKRILLPTGNGSSPRSCLAPESWSVKKVDIVKVLKLFSYLQNYQSYGPGSVEQSPKTGILIPTGNGSSPIWTKLGVDIPHGASTNPWNFEPCGLNHKEGEQEFIKMPQTRFFTP